MGCTTILVGKKASYDGSTMVARNEDSPEGRFTAKNFKVVMPSDNVKVYKSVLSDFSIEIDKKFLRHTAMPDAVNKYGIWAAYGINELNVSVNGTETITANDRIVSADPMQLDGIGEEDIVSICLPYIHSAREGVKHLGAILEKYGTYEKNGIAFQDENEIWWLETIGGHNYIAKRVPDESYVVIANQMGIDYFDFEDALTKEENHMCSKNMLKIIEEAHLDLSLGEKDLKNFNVRLALGTNFDNDHIYNTPRTWILQRYFNPSTKDSYEPDSDNIPWSRVPERKISVYDVKYALSNHYQGTDYDPYSLRSNPSKKGKFRTVGINRTNVLAMTQIRPYVDEEIKGIKWMALASNVFNTIVPFYSNVTKVPEYVSNAGDRVTVDNFYWANRLIGALADSNFNKTYGDVERYQRKTLELSMEILREYDRKFSETKDLNLLEEANEKIASMIKEKTDELLSKVLYTASMNMKNAFKKEEM